VIAYNAYSRANRVTIAHFDEFAHDLHDFFATGARIETGSSAAAARSAAAVPPPAVKK